MELSTTRVACVNYLNTQPFLYGLTHSKKINPEAYELLLETPSNCARLLKESKVHIGLVPVASLLNLAHYEINTDYCIGAVGRVDSVLLISELPINQITHIQLDYQSNTSVALCKFLCRELWKINPEFISTENDSFISKTRKGVASVVIGNRALEQFNKFPNQIDLSEAWNKLTGLPFVFAVWASVESVPQNFIQGFNEALSFGIQNIESSIQEVKSIYPLSFQVDTYLKHRISYILDKEKLMGLETFLKAIR